MMPRSGPSVNPKADAVLRVTETTNTPTPRPAAARHGPAGPFKPRRYRPGGQAARSHHDGDVPRLASSKLPPARRRARFSHS